MATSFIVVKRSDANAIFASDLIAAVRYADQLHSQLSTIANKMAEMVDGTDYSQIETLYGVPAGKGQALKAVVDDFLAALSSGAPDSFRSRLG